MSRFRRPVRAGIAALGIALISAALGTPSPAYAVDQDRPAFYQTPADLPAENGAVIRSEPMTYRLDPAQVNTVVMNSWRVLYKSTDRAGQPIAVSGTIMVPKTRWTGRGERPIIAYAPGTQGMADRCAPSRQFSEGLEYEGIYITGLLKRGYAIAMTDYEGLGTAGMHTYMDRQSQAHTVLDAVRAAQKLPATGLSTSNPVGIQGYSQGGGAGASAAELASEYAPELRVRGAVVGAVPADLKAVSQKIDHSLYTDFVLYAARGLAESYDIDPADFANELGLQTTGRIEDHCQGGASVAPFVRTSTLTTSGLSFAQMADSEPWRTIVAEQRIGNRAPRVPVLVTHSVLDDVIPYDQARSMARSWCRSGANVRFSTNATPTHIAASMNNATEAYLFWEARFAGWPQINACWRI
ncbi:MAG: lipase family protein [Propionibacteriaceae bacterium]|nr:lipase family protein [Propionibacteriaceae bacterium]